MWQVRDYSNRPLQPDLPGYWDLADAAPQNLEATPSSLTHVWVMHAWSASSSRIRSWESNGLLFTYLPLINNKQYGISRGFKLGGMVEGGLACKWLITHLLFLATQSPSAKCLPVTAIVYSSTMHETNHLPQGNCHDTYLQPSAHLSHWINNPPSKECKKGKGCPCPLSQPEGATQRDNVYRNSQEYCLKPGD